MSNTKTIFEKYKRLQKSGVHCPLLNKNIRITRKGWDHIVRGSKSKRRNIKDKNVRLKLLDDMSNVIKYADFSETTIKNNSKYVTLIVKNRKVMFNQSIKVLLKEDKQGNLTFYSIMKLKK